MEHVTGTDRSINLPFAEWLPRQRWYGGRRRELSEGPPGPPGSLRDDLDVAILDVGYTDGTSERYQVLVGWGHGPLDGHGSIATIGESGGRTAYDAMYDAGAAKILLSLIDQSATIEPLQFAKEPGAV